MAGKLAKQYDIKVEYWGWGTFTEKLHRCDTTRREYYSKLLPETDHFTEAEFKDSIKANHFIDQLYKSLFRFDGFRYLDPKVISRLYPFKITDEYDSTGFRFGCLRTDNAGFETFFSLLRKKGDGLVVNQSEVKRRKIKVDDIEDKVDYVINFLKTSSINCINTPNGEHNKVFRPLHKGCLCDACLWGSFRLEELATIINKPSNEHPNGHVAHIYGLYKLNQFDKARKVSEEFTREEINPVKQFIGRYNEYWLGRLGEEKMNPPIDLDYELTKLEIKDLPVRQALIDLKECKIVHQAHLKIDDYLKQIEIIYEGYKAERLNTNGPNYVWFMNDEMYKVYSYYRYNYLVLDVYDDFRKVCLKAFKCWLLSHLTSENYNNRLEKFHILPVAIALFYISGKDLKSIFNEYEVDMIKFHTSTSTFLEEHTIRFLESVIVTDSNKNYNGLISKEGIGGNHRQYLQAILLMLAYGGNQKVPARFFKLLKSFLSQDQPFFHHDISYLGDIFLKKGKWFTWKEHDELLNVIIRSPQYRSASLVEGIIKSRKNNYPKVKFSDEEIAEQLLLELTRNRRYAESVVATFEISDSSLQETIKNSLDKSLLEKFDESIYRPILFNKVNDELAEKYFKDYIKWIDRAKGISIGKNSNGTDRILSYEFLNSVSAIISARGRDYLLELKNELSQLDSYQTWLLDPDSFDYQRFNMNWVKFSDIDIVLKHLGQSDKLMEVIRVDLREKYNERLALLYARML